MIDIRFLGGAREVGRSGILLDTGVEKFLFDYGIEVQDNTHPIQPDIRLDGIFISHAHMDHSGFIPDLYRRGYSGPVFMTPPTADLTSILLRDSLKVQKKRGDELHFMLNDIKKAERHIEFMEPGQRQEFSVSNAEFFHAGHIPGSVLTLLESKGKRILYTGDIKFIDTALMKGAFSEFKDIDVIISESTYSYGNHPDRRGLEDELKKIVQDTVYNNGIAVIPAFAVGRTQEMLIILSKLGFPVFVDGMGIRATEKILKHQKSVRDYKTLKGAFDRATKVKRDRMRKEVIQNPCVIITTAGMLNGGPIVYYLSHLWKRQDCSLTLTGFQVPGTAGRGLMDTGRYDNGEVDLRPQMKMNFLDFSAHTDRDHLLEFYKKVSPEKIILIHGEHTDDFSKDLNGMGFDTVAPGNGEKISV
ncbi:MAG: MBL fold metallo-hydrolase [Candidatus Aenigmarchaeota archaeon]|nr:MBL fold metallo-hydrolase [Candidatus Aenigmarchaeota archaeon]